jgi:hypothetical protein
LVFLSEGKKKPSYVTKDGFSRIEMS